MHRSSTPGHWPGRPRRIVGIGSLAVSVPQLQAEIYQYIDAKGTISLTNVPSDTRYRRIDSTPPDSIPFSQRTNWNR